MTDDVLKRARRALEGKIAPPAVPKPADADRPAPDRAKSATLLARAKAVIAAAPPPEPRAERVKLLMTCSQRGLSYLVIAERRGDELRFVGHEMQKPGPDGTSRLPAHLSGQYRIDANGWACPLCGNAGSVWLCDCAGMNGAMHCCGNTAGQYRCACGRIEQREFESIETAEVRGVSVAARPGRSGNQHGQPRFKQVTHERNR